MLHQELPTTLVTAILKYLDLTPGRPSVRNLNRLMSAYVQKIPWESLTRILKQRKTSRLEDCPRWPVEFWNDAIHYGTGGTCFETNYAFFSLLQALGYMGYLTVNDMGEIRGCHAAIVILLAGRKYLVDVSLPFDRAVQLHSFTNTRLTTPLQTIIIRPLSYQRYQVTRTHHPHVDIFTLVDVPVSTFEYECVLTRDYLPSGWFLDKIVIVKAVGQKIWRFNSSVTPLKVETVGTVIHQEIPLDPKNLACQLSDLFGISIRIVAGAVNQIMPGLGPQRTVPPFGLADNFRNHRLPELFSMTAQEAE